VGRPAWHADARTWRALFAAALVVVLVFALKPARPPEMVIPHADKVKHFLAFAVLWVLGAWAGVRPRWLLAAGLLAYGGAIEGLQSLTPTREPSWGDWAADAFGLLAGYAVALRWSPVRARIG
jgi:VanZ family protein